MALSKFQSRKRIKQRIRKTIEGTAQRPRMSVYRSNKNITVQLIDDIAGKTLVSASSQNKEVVSSEAKTKSETSGKVGELIAKRATEAGIQEVVFDRNGYRYHGRVKALADGARNGGLKF